MTITDEMVDRALNAWFASPPSETDQGLERSMRAALEAAFTNLSVEMIDCSFFGVKRLPNCMAGCHWPKCERPASQERIAGKVCGYHDGCPPDGPVCHLCAHLQPGNSK